MEEESLVELAEVVLAVQAKKNATHGTMGMVCVGACQQAPNAKEKCRDCTDAQCASLRDILRRIALRGRVLEADGPLAWVGGLPGESTCRRRR